MVSRKSSVIHNIVTDVMLQVLSAVSNFIIPQLILQKYGSTMNGLINSITQFFSYLALAEAGVGAAAVVALYKPIASNNYADINTVLTEVRKRYNSSAAFYAGLSFLLAVLYPLTVKGQADYQFTFWMVIILAGAGLIDFWLIGKYKVFLIAVQKYYVLNIYKGIRVLVVFIGTYFLLMHSVDLISLKAFAVGVHFVEALCLKWYMKCYFPEAHFYGGGAFVLEQQRNALLHQICNVIIYNTDIVVLTLGGSNGSLKEVSVYTVYALVLSMMTNLMKALTNGISATFGEMLARGNSEEVKSVFDCYEYWYLIILYSIYTCFIVLIVPFVICYTEGISDVDYARFEVGLLFGLNGIFAQLKDATGTLITASGHYKQTQKYVVSEAVVNILVSLMLVNRYGIVGVLIGTLISHVVSDIGWVVYTNQKILKRKISMSIKKNLRNMLLTVILVMTECHFTGCIENWKTWIASGVLCGSVNLALFILLNGLADNRNFRKGMQFVTRVKER